MQKPYGAEVDARVSIEDVTELVRDDALQLVAPEQMQGAVRHPNHGVAGRVSRGKRVDAGFPVQDIHLGNGHPRCNGHLFDDIEQAALL